MPRLVGKRSNPTPAIAFFVILAAAAFGVALEYDGYINVVPGYGRTAPPAQRSIDIK